MCKYLWRVGVITTGIVSFGFTFVPETLFQKIKLFGESSTETNILINRLLVFLLVGILVLAFYSIYLACRQKIFIKGRNYSIKISYEDILKTKDSKKVIPFDECFTTSVGELPSQIKPSSICGQYLKENEGLDVEKLIVDASIKPARGKSKYNNQVCYASGTIVPNGDDLLLAFAKLDSSGLGCMKYEEYIDSLMLLWKEIDKHYGQKDVCIPIIGSGITRIGEVAFTQQELLDTIINSYKLSRYKIKEPAKLHIVCKKAKGFSLNKIQL